MRRLHVALLLLLASGPVLADSPNVHVTLTDRDSGDRLTEKASVSFHALPQPPESDAMVVVDPTHRYQTMVGIGGALTDAAAETFAKLPAACQAEVLRAYYDPVNGIGYSLGRTPINSCDFSSESYTYVQPGDTELRTFSVAHDMKYRIPFIQRVLTVNPDLKLFASPWSPPAWMKTNNDMLHGGKLKPEDDPAWAHYYVKFIQAYAAQHIPIWGLTLQNEPLASQTWESCIYTAEEERDFAKNFLGPALHDAGLDNVKLMVWDHNRGLMYQQASTILSDPQAARYVWGTAFHWYVNDVFDNVEQVHEAFPDKALLFSEGCHGPFDTKQLDDWKWGEVYARSMINDFNHWTCGWTDWNILLNEHGGPNHVGNYCFAPIIADTKHGTLHYMNSYYYIGHFSKFVRPGAQRIACTVSNDDLLATAFVNPDGQIATIVLNTTDQPTDFQVWVAGQAAATHLPAHAIATLTWHS